MTALLMVACSGCLVLLCQVNLSSAANGMIPPRGYCTQISRAIPKQSRCYNHLLQFHLGAAAAAAAAHRKRSSLNDSYENNAANWNKEELVYVRLETIGSKIEALNTVAINERLVFGTFKGLFGGSVTNNERIHTASSQQANDVVAQILGSNELNGDSRQALRCREAIERFLCRLIYPNCHFKHDASVLVRPTCREDCLVLRDVLCPNLDWPKFSLVLRRTFNETLKATINSLDLAVENQSKDYTNLAAIVSSSSNNEQHQQQQQQRLLEIPSDSNHFYWPHEHSIDRCESLPPLRFITKPIETPLDAQERPYESPTGQWSPRRNLRWPICSNAHLTRTLPANGGLNDRAQSKQADCLSTSEGAGYVGHKNQTKDGLWCQAWHSQWPHSHTR